MLWCGSTAVALHALRCALPLLARLAATHKRALSSADGTQLQRPQLCRALASLSVACLALPLGCPHNAATLRYPALCVALSFSLTQPAARGWSTHQMEKVVERESKARLRDSGCHLQQRSILSYPVRSTVALQRAKTSRRDIGTTDLCPCPACGLASADARGRRRTPAHPAALVLSQASFRPRSALPAAVGVIWLGTKHLKPCCKSTKGNEAAGLAVRPPARGP